MLYQISQYIRDNCKIKNDILYNLFSASRNNFSLKMSFALMKMQNSREYNSKIDVGWQVTTWEEIGGNLKQVGS